MTTNRRDGSFQRVLVPIDLLIEPREALDLAADLAETPSGVTLLHVVEPAPSASKIFAAPYFDADAFEKSCVDLGTRDLRQLAEAAKGRGLALDPEIAVVVGRPADTIIGRAEVDEVDLIVLPLSRRSAVSRFFLGSVAEEVQRRARGTAVLTVPVDDDEAKPIAADAGAFREIVVPVDVADVGAWASLDVAIAIAERHGASVHVLTVVDQRGGDAFLGPGLKSGPNVANLLAEAKRHAEEVIAAELERRGGVARGVQLAGHALLGHPASAIVDFARGRDADLIVMASWGRRGLADQVLGSTAERVLRRSDRPVLTLR